MADFTHLHVHTEYSLLDGLSKISELVAKAKEYKMHSLAVTDHGVMYGVLPFYLACKENNINPIIGCEIYVANNSRFDKQPTITKDQSHLILLAKNNKGYKNLMKIVTLAHLEGFYYKPRADKKLLEKYHEGLIATTACLEGKIPSLLIQGKDNEAEKEAKKLYEIFGEDFYLEVQNHPEIEKQEVANKKIIDLSRKIGIPIVATNDVHYVDKEDAEAQDALLAVQTKKMIADKDRLTMLDSPDFYLRSSEEMEKLFIEYPDAINNTLKIAEKCKITIKTGEMIFPVYPLPKKETAKQYLKELTWKRAKKRFPKRSAEIKKRIDYELDVICNKGYATYFLIVQDFVNWAKEQGIRVGPGRGSAAGSLVSYILRITSINPLEHGLPFERFLNPFRPSPPDIDLDFADDRRDEVINYVTSKYGKDKVAQVITFGTMEARGSIRDIGRVLSMPYSEPDKIAKLIPTGFSIEEALNSVFELQELYKEDKYKKLINLAKKVEGCARHASTHAAAVIISDKPLTEYTPLQREARGERIITQYDMYALDLNISETAIGLLKMDFLGLRNLSTLQKAIDLVEENTGEKIDISDIPIDDKDVYGMISQGETVGIFQLESGGMRRVARNLKPTAFSDITAMVALYRPGPMELIPEFIKGKENKDSISYPHSDLKQVLSETYGIAVYQEQCLQIANIMAGYSMGEADILRRAIGKKKKSIMAKEKKKFIAGAKKKGYSQKTADKVWGYIERFAGYGFNKAHSASYAMIAYQTAYIKVHYPVEFMTALLTAESMATSGPIKDEKISRAIEECKRMSIYVFPPDINQSKTWFNIESDSHSLEDKAIRFGLAAIKNVGEAAIESILKARKKGDFKSLSDFCNRVDNQKVNKKVLESLIQVGALDHFGKRSAMLSGLEKIRQKAAEEQKKKESGQTSLFDNPSHKDNPGQNIEPKDDLPQIDEFSPTELLALEKNLLGIYLSDDPHQKNLSMLKSIVSHEIFEINNFEHVGKRLTIGGVVGKIKKVYTKRGNNEMAFLNLNDKTGTIEVVIFPQLFSTAKDILQENKVVVIEGKIDFKEERLTMIAEKIMRLEEIINLKKNNKAYEIRIPRTTAKNVLNKLASLLQNNRGEDKVVIILPNGGEDKKIIIPYGVNYNSELQKKVSSLLSSDQ